jgi:hypothetical protein
VGTVRVVQRKSCNAFTACVIAKVGMLSGSVGVRRKEDNATFGAAADGREMPDSVGGGSIDVRGRARRRAQGNSPGGTGARGCRTKGAVQEGDAQRHVPWS